MYMTDTHDGIRELMAELLAAWQARDLARYLALLSPDVDVVNRGGKWMRGRAAAADQFGWLMSEGLPTIFTARHTVEAVRPLGDDAAVVHERRVEPERESVAVYMVVRRDGWWRVESISIVPVQRQAH
jgi:uncharacterized protein (TIGR02246 family)